MVYTVKWNLRGLAVYRTRGCHVLHFIMKLPFSWGLGFGVWRPFSMYIYIYIYGMYIYICNMYMHIDVHNMTS